jgi:hypothetical protein
VGSAHQIGFRHNLILQTISSTYLLQSKISQL